MRKVYVSGALTGVTDPAVKAFYESIGSVCEDLGLDAYVPHLNTDPINNPDATPTCVFETDKDKVITSDLVIAYVGTPSLGVGMELAYAEANKIPIVLLSETGNHVSRFPRGIPTIVTDIAFDDYQDGLTQLKGALEQWGHGVQQDAHRFASACSDRLKKPPPATKG